MMQMTQDPEGQLLISLYCITSMWRVVPQGMEEEGWLMVTLHENNFPTETMPLKLFIHNHSLTLKNLLVSA